MSVWNISVVSEITNSVWVCSFDFVLYIFLSFLDYVGIITHLSINVKGYHFMPFFEVEYFNMLIRI